MKMLIHNLNHKMDDDLSSNESYDSDQVDSDIEAELYSTIHHEAVSAESSENDPERNSSINFISVEKNSNVIEKQLDSNSNLNMNFGKACNINQSDENNRSNKRKSSIIANILGTIQVENESPKKKQKTVNHENKKSCSRISSGNTTIELSDSDSSVILSEPDESSVLKLQTNVETLYVSSDSETSVTCMDERSLSYFEQSEDNSSSGNSRDLWKINDTDLYRTKRNSAGRYHENAVSQCTNCKEKGHVARHCTEARVTKCFICGGVHMGARCKSKICIKCLRYGHDSRRCFFPFDTLVCTICNMRGHAQKCCPDLWRRYHLTTSRGRIVKGQTFFQSNAVYCFNCGLQGHFGFDCNKSRMGQPYPTWPSVISYEHPGGSFDRLQVNRDFNINFPQLKVPPIVSVRKEKKRLLYKELRKERKMKKKQKKAVKKLAHVKKEGATNSSILSNSNFEHGNVRVKQEIDFPRTPKSNTNTPQCIDEMPKIKRMNHKQRRKQAREAMKVLKNCT